MSIEQEIIESFSSFQSPFLSLFLLKEVGRGHPGGNDPLGVGDGLEEFGLARVHVAVGKLEDGGDVAAPVAVVWRRPHCHQLIVEHVLVTFEERKEMLSIRTMSQIGQKSSPTFLYQLVRPADELEVVPLHELVSDLLAEQPPGAPWAHGPSLHFLRVGPNQITESTWINEYESFIR